jgi:hypothetical protein
MTSDTETWREIHEITRDGSTTWDVMTFRPHSSMGSFVVHTERFDTEAEAQHWMEWC